ncbi:hypothetical protein LS68_000400 [Helicobacter sp. MIT 05-5293]|uniref:hypothetical protein n=1 Tax=Helicobacter sp. MIT 05-5293 TaxID=1548149 RepID=UPI00051DF6B8|nr:hypothetical protein [Helicobacter sp. MIT 05-5293]TLD81540.1 hypothetical protein LS68_000400 [Helicobacter sp. MIT 05-5293]
MKYTQNVIMGFMAAVMVFIISGCGNNFKCDDKDYAEQALNILFFSDASGKNELNLTIQKLGFEVGNIQLLNLDKDKKSSVCKVEIANSYVQKSVETFKSIQKGDAELPETDFTKTYFSVARLSKDALLIGLVANNLYEHTFNSKEIRDNFNIQDMQILIGIATIATQLASNGMTYKTYDNGAGDLMIEVLK